MTLEPCPDSPNCVSTKSDPGNSTHYIAPMTFSCDADAVIGAVESVVISAGGAIEQLSEDRLEAVFTSKIFKFKDDVTFYVDSAESLLHFRSASRTGHSDLGVNRKRMKVLISQISSTI